MTSVEIPFSLGIPKEEYERDRDLGDQYFKLEDKFREATDKHKWSEAESVCGRALQIAEQLASHRGLEKIDANNNVGFAYLYQRRSDEAFK